MLHAIEEVFSQLPHADVLATANEIRIALQADPTLIQLKDKKEYVTQADIKIQRCLVEYFATSSLGGAYVIKAEEELSPEERKHATPTSKYQLLIDPLDGTSAFCKGEETWGSMIGLCDREGRILYSWNLVSSGGIYSTTTALQNKKVRSWDDSLRAKGSLNIDLFDYGAGAADRFSEVVEAQSGGKVTAAQVRVTSYPSAVWAGWGLYSGRLDALLWLPSNQGKRNYPDYDLIFLGALKEQGWRIALGKQGDAVHLVAVASCPDELEILWNVGTTLTGSEVTSFIEYTEELQITSPIVE